MLRLLWQAYVLECARLQEVRILFIARVVLVCWDHGSTVGGEPLKVRKHFLFLFLQDVEVSTIVNV